MAVCYLPRKYPAHASIRPVAKTELYPAMFPLLDMSKGLPPPDPGSGFGVAFDAGVEPAAAPTLLDVVIVTGTASGVVVLVAVVTVV